MSEAAMDEVLITDWESMGLPEEGQAEVSLDKVELKTYGWGDKLQINATVHERPNGGTVGDEFMTGISLTGKGPIKLRNLIQGSGLKPEKTKGLTRQDIAELAKALEGETIWTTITHYTGNDGETRPYFGFKFAKTLEELVG